MEIMPKKKNNKHARWKYCRRINTREMKILPKKNKNKHTWNENIVKTTKKKHARGQKQTHMTCEIFTKKMKNKHVPEVRNKHATSSNFFYACAENAPQSFIGNINDINKWLDIQKSFLLSTKYCTFFTIYE